MMQAIIGFYLGIAVCLLKGGIEDLVEGSKYQRRKRDLEAAIAEHNENVRLFGVYMSTEDAEKEKAELNRLKAELEELENDSE